MLCFKERETAQCPSHIRIPTAALASAARASAIQLQVRHRDLTFKLATTAAAPRPIPTTGRKNRRNVVTTSLLLTSDTEARMYFLASSGAIRTAKIKRDLNEPHP